MKNIDFPHILAIIGKWNFLRAGHIYWSKSIKNIDVTHALDSQWWALKCNFRSWNEMRLDLKYYIMYYDDCTSYWHAYDHAHSCSQPISEPLLAMLNERIVSFTGAH